MYYILYKFKKNLKKLSVKNLKNVLNITLRCHNSNYKIIIYRNSKNELRLNPLFKGCYLWVFRFLHEIVYSKY